MPLQGYKGDPTPEEDEELNLYDELKAGEIEVKKILGALIYRIMLLAATGDWEHYINAVNTLEAMLWGYLKEDGNKSGNYHTAIKDAVRELKEKQGKQAKTRYQTLNEARDRQLAIELAQAKFRALNVFLRDRGFYPRDTLG